jgi:copper chaperone CopZ
MQKQVFKVSDMHCPNCPMHLQELEDELAGVLEVNASYQKMEMVVNFDESKVTVEQIITATKELGYTAQAIEK